MKGSFKFNEVSSEDLGLFIQVPPSYTFPTRDISSVTIPGRNGDLYIDNGSYKQSERTYSVAAKIMPGSNIYSHAGKVVEWLNSTKGKYFRLEDSYDNDVFRMATFISSGSVTNYYDEAFAFNISFKCKPQRFLKSGELEITFTGNDSYITNPTGYESKPDIKVSIPAEYYDYSKVLMLSIINEEDWDKTVSNVTINIPASEYRDNMIIDIDSENMTVMDENQNDLSYYISMNGGNFPEFKGGQTELLLAKYDKINTTYRSYKAVIDDYISDNNGYVKSEFKPYDAILKEKAVSTYFQSYEQLLGSKQETYVASSVQAQALTKANKFTVPSINTYLNSQAAAITVGSEEVGVDLDDGDETLSFGFKVEKDGDDKLLLRATRNGYFFVKGKDKYIRYIAEGGALCDSFKSSDIVTVYSYKTDYDSTLQKNILHISDYLGILPDWLNANMVYEEIDGKRTPTKIEYIGTRSAKYWFPKASGIIGGLMSKDHWEAKDANSKLETLSWNTGKYAFTKKMSVANLNPSTTEELTFYMIEGNPEYDDVTEVTEDEDGNKQTNVVSKCYFEVVNWDPSNNTVRIVIKNSDDKPFDGWYKISINDEKSISRWNYLKEGDALSELGITISASDSFVLNRIGYNESSDEREMIDSSHIPNYWFKETTDKEGNKIPGWPDFISPYIYNSNNDQITSLHDLDFTDGQESKIYIRVTIAGYYRYLEKIENGENFWSNFEFLYSYNLIDVNNFNKKVTNSFYIDKMDEDPESIKWEHNRCYSYGDGRPGEEKPDTQDPPSWLNVEETFVSEEAEADSSKTPKKMIYRANANGLYKWDDNTSWISKKAGDLLLETDGRDNTVFNYMSNKPNYPEEETDKIHVDITTDPITGNPTKMIFMVKVPGYYRVNNESNWKKYKENDPILESDINIENIVYYLDPTNDQLDTVTINVVPRWWML